MEAKDYPVVKKLNNFVSLLPDKKLRNELYEICESLLTIGAGLGAMAGFAEVASPFSAGGKKALESSISELKGLKDYLADEAKKLV